MFRVRGTIHNRNFDGICKWYFVEELTCDLLFGLATPNDEYIKDNGKPIRDDEVKDWFSEGLVVTGEPLWYNIPDKPWMSDFTHINIEIGSDI
jgi:hypothetical protein